MHYNAFWIEGLMTCKFWVSGPQLQLELRITPLHYRFSRICKFLDPLETSKSSMMRLLTNSFANNINHVALNIDFTDILQQYRNISQLIQY